MIDVVALEGIDMSGKTTTLKTLKGMCRNPRIHFNKGPIYPNNVDKLLAQDNLPKKKRDYLHALHYIIDHIKANSQYQNDDRTVIQDRYWPSVVAYGKFLHGKQSIHESRDLTSKFIQPISTFLFKCSYGEVGRRSLGRKHSEIDKILLSSYANFKRLEKEIEDSVCRLPNVIKIDTTSKPMQEVAKEMHAHIRAMGLD